MQILKIILILTPMIGHGVYSSTLSPEIVESFKKTPYFVSKKYELEDDQKLLKIINEESPWSVSGLYQTTKNLINDENLSGSDTSLSHQLQAGLNYQRRNSLDLSLTTTYQKTDFEEPTLLEDSTSDSHSINFKAGYSLNQNGLETASNLSRKAEEYSTNISYLQSIETLNSQVLSYQNSLIDLTITNCKKSEITKIASIINRTINKGKKLYQINQISRQDYLNFLDLYNRYRANIQSLQNNSDLLKNELSYFLNPNELEKITRKLSAICNQKNIYSEVIQKSKKLSTNASSKMEKIYTKTNSYKIFHNRIKSNVINQKSLSLSESSNLVPFIELQTSRSVFEDKNDHAIIAGLDISWSPPSRETNLRSKLFKYRKKYIPISRDVEELNFKRSLQEITATHSTNLSLLNILRENLSSVNQLIKYFDAQSGVQKISSINYSNTYLRKADIISSIFDIISSTEKSNFRLEVLTNNLILMK